MHTKTEHPPFAKWSVSNYWQDDVYNNSAGGEAPAFLSPYVVDYIVSGDFLQV